jgi:hypothetical protein
MLRTKTTVSQTAFVGTRIRAESRAGMICAIVMAKQTIVRTPYRPDSVGEDPDAEYRDELKNNCGWDMLNLRKKTIE